MSSYSLKAAQAQLSRLIDEALAGEPVTITRDGEAVVELRPVGQGRRDVDIAWLRARRAELPRLGGDAAAIVRAMRDEER